LFTIHPWLTIHDLRLEFRFVHLHFIRPIHIVLHSSDRQHSFAAWQSRRRCALFEQSFKHSLWTTWDRELVGENYDWRSGGIHARRFDVVVTDADRVPFGSAIESRERSDFDTYPVANTTTVAGDKHSATNSTGRITVQEQVDCRLV